jgi:hypothetical protein
MGGGRRRGKAKAAQRQERLASAAVEGDGGGAGEAGGKRGSRGWDRGKRRRAAQLRLDEFQSRLRGIDVPHLSRPSTVCLVNECSNSSIVH